MSKRSDTIRAKLAAEELLKRKSAEALQIGLAKQFLDEATKDNPWQAEIINDPSLHKGLFGERRSGKSTLMGICAVEKALRSPHSQILYIGLVADSCQKVMYDAVFPQLIRNFNLPAKLVGSDEMRFSNGSIIYLVGLNANKTQKEKVRGVKASLIIIDEMQSYSQDIKLAILEILGPAAADTKAPMIIAGTAGNALGKNYWYEITINNTKEDPIGQSKLHPEWKVFRCAWANNRSVDEMTGARVCDNVRDYLDSLIKDHPGIEQTPSFRQEWNAEWIVETSALIYRFTNSNLLTSPDCCEIGSGDRIAMPSASFLSTANFILGLDLGYNDPTAMTVCGYNLKFSNKLYVIETFNKSEMLVPEVAAKIKQLDNLYHFSKMVGDSSSLQVFETLRTTYGLPIEKANRSGKLSHQLVLNSDLQTRSVVIMPGNELLVKQLESLIWERKALIEGRYVEDPSYQNDQADSFLYCHHFSRHLWYLPTKQKINFPNQQQQYDILSNRLLKRNKPQGLFAEVKDWADTSGDD